MSLAPSYDEGTDLYSALARRQSVETWTSASVRTWVHIDDVGSVDNVVVEKHALVHELGLRYRDLLSLDSDLPEPAPASILIREKAIVFNVDAVRLIICANQVYVIAVPRPDEPWLPEAPTVRSPLVMLLCEAVRGDAAGRSALELVRASAADALQRRLSVRSAYAPVGAACGHTGLAFSEATKRRHEVEVAAASAAAAAAAGGKAGASPDGAAAAPGSGAASRLGGVPPEGLFSISPERRDAPPGALAGGPHRSSPAAIPHPSSRRGAVAVAGTGAVASPPALGGSSPFDASGATLARPTPGGLRRASPTEVSSRSPSTASHAYFLPPASVASAQAGISRASAYGGWRAPGPHTPFDSDLPYELRALEVALSCVSCVLTGEVTHLERQGTRLLDALASRLTSVVLEETREFKARLGKLTQRVARTRTKLGEILADDEDMGDMYLARRAELEGTELPRQPSEPHRPAVHGRERDPSIGGIAPPGRRAPGGVDLVLDGVDGQGGAGEAGGDDDDQDADFPLVRRRSVSMPGLQPEEEPEEEPLAVPFALGQTPTQASGVSPSPPQGPGAETAPSHAGSSGAAVPLFEIEGPLPGPGAAGERAAGSGGPEAGAASHASSASPAKDAAGRSASGSSRRSSSEHGGPSRPSPATAEAVARAFVEAGVEAGARRAGPGVPLPHAPHVTLAASGAAAHAPHVTVASPAGGFPPRARRSPSLRVAPTSGLPAHRAVGTMGSATNAVRRPSPGGSSNHALRDGTIPPPPIGGSRAWAPGRTPVTRVLSAAPQLAHHAPARTGGFAGRRMRHRRERLVQMWRDAFAAMSRRGESELGDDEAEEDDDSVDDNDGRTDYDDGTSDGGDDDGDDGGTGAGDDNASEAGEEARERAKERAKARRERQLVAEERERADEEGDARFRDPSQPEEMSPSPLRPRPRHPSEADAVEEAELRGRAPGAGLVEGDAEEVAGLLGSGGEESEGGASTLRRGARTLRHPGTGASRGRLSAPPPGDEDDEARDERSLMSRLEPLDDSTLGASRSRPALARLGGGRAGQAAGMHKVPSASWGASLPGSPTASGISPQASAAMASRLGRDARSAAGGLAHVHSGGRLSGPISAPPSAPDSPRAGPARAGKALSRSGTLRRPESRSALRGARDDDVLGAASRRSSDDRAPSPTAPRSRSAGGKGDRKHAQKKKKKKGKSRGGVGSPEPRGRQATRTSKNGDDRGGSFSLEAALPGLFATQGVDPHDIEEVEDQLECYFVDMDTLSRRLAALSERVDATEDLLEIRMDHRRNELVAVDLIVTLLTAGMAWVAMVAGFFGMNLYNSTWQDSWRVFVYTCLVCFVGVAILVGGGLIVIRQRKLMFIPTAF